MENEFDLEEYAYQQEAAELYEQEDKYVDVCGEGYTCLNCGATTPDHSCADVWGD